MKTDSIWVLIAKMLTGDASHTELAEIENAAKNDPELAFTIKVLLRFWHHTPAKREQSTLDRLMKCIVPQNKKY